MRAEEIVELRGSPGLDSGRLNWTRTVSAPAAVTSEHAGSAEPTISDAATPPPLVPRPGGADLTVGDVSRSRWSTITPGRGYDHVVRFVQAPLLDAWVLHLDRHVDERGSFARTYCEVEFAEHGMPTHFPQSNISTNRVGGTLRGMHFNSPRFAEAKLVRCTRGAIYDVIVDLRTTSPTFCESFGIELDADGGVSLFIPEGFAHGFVTLVDHCDVMYSMGRIYAPDAALGFRWDDPAFGIRWPREPRVISDRDASFPDFDVSC